MDPLAGGARGGHGDAHRLGVGLAERRRTGKGDELATLGAASRSLPGRWEPVGHIDGHFLPYYLFMHLWVKAGTAELWLRLPSAPAIGVAVWFLVDLGRRPHHVRGAASRRWG
jgi:hypothetical protein